MFSTRAKTGVDGLQRAFEVKRLFVLDGDRGLEFADFDLQFGNLVAQAIPFGFLPFPLCPIILAEKEER